MAENLTSYTNPETATLEPEDLYIWLNERLNQTEPQPLQPLVRNELGEAIPPERVQQSAVLQAKYGQMYLLARFLGEDGQQRTQLRNLLVQPLTGEFTSKVLHVFEFYRDRQPECYSNAFDGMFGKHIQVRPSETVRANTLNGLQIMLRQLRRSDDERAAQAAKAEARCKLLPSPVS